MTVNVKTNDTATISTNFPVEVTFRKSSSKSIQTRIVTTARDPKVIEAAGNIADNPWLQTVFAPYVKAMTRSKGKYGEVFAHKILADHGLFVENTSDTGNDRRISGYLSEVKFSLAQFDKKKNHIVENRWMLNHISGSKSWERLVFIGINPDTNKSFIGWMSKQDFYTALGTVDKNNRSIYFSHQQGGQAGNNDDYMSAGKKLARLISDGVLKDISTW